MLCCGAFTSLESSPPFNADAEAPQYHLKINFDANAHFINAVETVRYVNNTRTTLEELHFNIYANKVFLPEEKQNIGFYQNYFKVNMFPEGIQSPDFRIKMITTKNSPLSHNITGPFLTVLIVSLDKPLREGEEIELSIEFDLKLPNSYGVLGHYQGINYLGHWYPVLSVYKNGRWHDNPLGADHQPYFNDASYYDVELTINAGQVVAHTGHLVDTLMSRNDGTKTLRIKTDLVRDFTFATSSLYQVLSGEAHDVLINLFYLPEDEECARKGLEYAITAMDFYIETFGSYPYPVFNIAETHIGWLGNEFSNIIFIDSRGFNLPDILYRHLDFLISHEMAHQWWYLQVGSDQFAQTWLDEAFASYAGDLYLESKYGKYNNYLELPQWALFLPNTSFREARTQRYLYAAKNNLDERVSKSINQFSRPEYVFPAAYDKGTWILDMLRYLVGDEDFFKIMRTYIDKFRYKTAEPSDFIRVTEEITQTDLDWFFDQWLLTTGKCDYGISGVKRYYREGRWDTRFIIERHGEIQMPVVISATTENGEEIVKQWDGRGETKEYVLQTSDKITKILVDPNRRLLDYRLQNNYWPRRVNVKHTPYYPIIYDFPVLNPSDSYSVVAGATYNVFNAGFRIVGRRVYDYMSYLDCRYDFHHREVTAKVGHNIEHAMGKETLLGLELAHTRSVDSIEQISKARLSLTKQLGPTVYSIDKMLNDITFYFERNREIVSDKTTIHRSKVGLRYSKDYRILAWDPVDGMRYSINVEKGSEIFGANTDFTKGELDVRFYQKLWNSRHMFALRFNAGLSDGEVNGEELFKLGGKDTLRGYSDEEFESQNKLLGNVEYRFPLIKEREESILRNFFTFNRLNGVVFYDIGLPWDNHFVGNDAKSNVGAGLRFEVTVLGFFEKTFNRLDVAVPLESPHDVHVWFEITHAF